jgi:mannan endo-1,4-beta-mannosidase
MRRFKCLAVFLLATAPLFAESFVERAGTQLQLDGQPFRYSGPNIEWLGLEGYGPHDAMGPRYPSHFEIDDAFATAGEMGGKVVRAQTLGDTVGCPLCIEPELGKFNESAFQAADYAIASAGKLGIRLIIPLIGDCATCSGGGIGQYLAWTGRRNPQDFFVDPALIAAFERHVDFVLNHRNAITGIRYRDDPTIMAWENCNMCGLLAIFMHGDPAGVAAWSETMGQHIKAMDERHLYLDTTGIFRIYPKVLENPSSDIVTFEEYPHWDKLLSGTTHTTASTLSQDAAAVTSRGKVFIVNEFGWDRTNWATQSDLQRLLDAIRKDRNISGDDFWALQAHLDNFGFQAIPADTGNAAFAEAGESGQWWALYYPGMKTLVMSAEEMAARAQQLRTHAYEMAGTAVPAHAIPPAPVITSTVLGGLVAWRGSAGAVRYSIERQAPGTDQWQLVCDRCAADSEDPWIDGSGASSFGARYRVTAYNADGAASQPSLPR